MAMAVQRLLCLMIVYTVTVFYTEACSCARPLIQDEFCGPHSADVVARVKVVSTEYYIIRPNGDITILDEADPYDFHAKARYTVETQEIYMGGSMLENDEVGYVHSSARGSTCRVGLSNDKDYVIFAKENDRGDWWVGRCSMTNRWDLIRDTVRQALTDFSENPESCMCTVADCAAPASECEDADTQCQQSVNYCYHQTSYCLMQGEGQCAWVQTTEAEVCHSISYYMWDNFDETERLVNNPVV